MQLILNLSWRNPSSRYIKIRREHLAEFLGEAAATLAVMKRVCRDGTDIFSSVLFVTEWFERKRKVSYSSHFPYPI